MPDGVRRVLTLVDMFLHLFIFTPITAVYWRGVWYMMDYYGSERTVLASGLVSCAFGFGGQVLIGYLQSPAETIGRKVYKKKFLWIVFTHVHTFLSGLVSINHWRGPWAIMDFYWGINPTSAFVCYFAGTVGLMVLRAFVNVTFPPMIIPKDNFEELFQFTYYFCTESRVDSLRYFGDVVFSIFVPATLTILSWRGLWGLFDVYLLPNPEDIEKTCWASFVIGYTLSILMYMGQFQADKLYRKYAGIRKMIIFLIYEVVGHIAAVNVWRALWKIGDIYYLPSPLIKNDGVVDFCSNIAVAWILLTIFQIINAATIKGVVRDTNVQDLLIPTQYFEKLLEPKGQVDVDEKDHFHKNMHHGGGGGAHGEKDDKIFYIDIQPKSLENKDAYQSNKNCKKSASMRKRSRVEQNADTKFRSFSEGNMRPSEYTHRDVKENKDNTQMY